PLRTQHINISKYSFLNQLVPSGAHALYLAHKERRQDNIGDDPNIALQRAGFEHWQTAALECGLDTDASKPTDGILFTVLPDHSAVAQHPPQIVFALMESWGSHLLDYDDPKRTDLLGRLRPWLYQKGVHFPHALASQNGTYSSLEALLLDTPISPLMQSSHGYKAYNTSRILPYKKQGYKTVFLTAGPRGWRQLDPTLLRQGFDEIHDAVSIKERYPQAETHTWGVDDEWMFQYAQELLETARANDEKIALFLLSVTNHPPHRVPSDYQPLSLDLENIQSDAVSDQDTTRSILETYQYASDALGGFLNGLEESGLLAETVIAATGDHPNRSVFNYSDSSQLHLRHGVPVWFYIPEAYRNAHYDEISRQQWTSHQDIFPTLWAHTLSGAIVPSSAGRNLFDPSADHTPTALTYNEELGQQSLNNRGLSISAAGAITHPLDPVFLKWSEGHLQPTDSPGAALLEQAQRTKACIALNDWRIRSQALR
ncbi:MAG TPA: LTA synthase family protein, partial [Paenalcaligenes sp.]|nr:LTA synthase family protein [Paenalcaligenes sp.]